MKIKYFLIILTAILGISAKAVTFDYTYEGSRLRYEITSESKCKVIRKVSVAAALSIPENAQYNGSSYNVTEIGEQVFENCTGVTSVTIPNSVTSIGDYAFYYCSGLTSVTIPSSVTSIGDHAFYCCSGLTSVTIPSSVTSIGDQAFSYCYGLTSVTIPSSVTSIGDYAFYCCNGLKSVTIPNSITSIGDWAFSFCSGLTSITIPTSVTSIGNGAFSCSGLTSVAIPSSVVTIGANPFSSCDNLESIIVDSDNQYYCSVEGVLFNKSKDILLSFPIGKETNTYNIPSSVTSIGGGAFDCCNGLKSVTIPNSVTSIGNYAFYYCTGLISVTLPNSVTSIGDYAFHYCTGLISITIPNSVTSIGKSAFSGCFSLTTVTIPNSVISIGDYAFMGSDKLTEIYCSAVQPPVCDYQTFLVVPTTCKVYVPKNSVEAYRAANCWNRFSNIIGYYVPGGENESLYIQDFVIETGKVAYMPVRLRAERDYSDFTTDVYLPEGLEVVKNEEGYIDVQYACVEDDAHLIFAESQPDGAIRVSVMSFGNAPMTGNSNEELFRLPVRATSSLASEPAPVWMRNTLFKDANYGYLFNDTNSNINSKLPNNISDVESTTCAPVEFYNLQGQPVVSPERGKMYIRVQGGKLTKVVF